MQVLNDSDSDGEEQKHPLQLLAKAARLMNATQMELSKDLTCHVSLPGTVPYTTHTSHSNSLHTQVDIHTHPQTDRHTHTDGSEVTNQQSSNHF